jgi:hypothetical protein
MDIFILYYLVFLAVYCSVCLINHLYNLCIINQNLQNDQNDGQYEIFV